MRANGQKSKAHLAGVRASDPGLMSRTCETIRCETAYWMAERLKAIEGFLAMQRPRLQVKLVVMMVSIAFLALGLAALKQPYQPGITILLISTIATLLASALASRFATSRARRAWCFGFSVFGWTHLLLVASAWSDLLPTTILTKEIVKWYTIHYGPYPTAMGRGPGYTNASHQANLQFYIGARKLLEIYFTLFVGGLGAMLTAAIAAWLERRSTRLDEPAPWGSPGAN
jgi:hypothetical protein